MIDPFLVHACDLALIDDDSTPRVARPAGTGVQDVTVIPAQMHTGPLQKRSFV